MCDSLNSCATVDVIIVVEPSNESPVISDTTVVTPYDSTITVCIPFTDADGTTPYTASIGCEDNGSATVAVVGNTVCVTYNPDNGFSGTDTLCLTLCDSLNSCTTVDVIVIVEPPNEPPVVLDTTTTTTQNTPVTICLPFTDYDGSAPYNASVGCADNGTATAVVQGNLICITYTPNANFIGNDTLCVTICDSTGTCSIADVIITVTPVTNPNPQLGIAKYASVPVEQSDKSFDVSYVIVVKNFGNVPLSNIQVTDNLNDVFSAPLTYSITAPVTASSSLTANTSFNGSSDINLLNSSLSTLALGEERNIMFTMNVKLNGFFGTVNNTANGSATGSNGTMVTDISHSGLNPDPNGNNIANEDGENLPTPVTFNEVLVIVPQGFSPNGDGVNDVLIIENMELYPENKITIFNRWGNIVFEKENYNNDWDGISNNSLTVGSASLPVGTYFYIVEVKGKSKPLSGYIYLNR